MPTFLKKLGFCPAKTDQNPKIRPIFCKNLPKKWAKLGKKWAEVGKSGQKIARFAKISFSL
jgi:hypothetical protein